MCGIVGYFDKRSEPRAPVGKILLRMMSALGRRGPDSAGAAVFGDPHGIVVRVKLGESGNLAARADAVTEAARMRVGVRATNREGRYLRLLVEGFEEVRSLESVLEQIHPEVEVISVGRRLEIMKEVGAPSGLEDTFAFSTFVGSHGIGHTRMSTESRVDLSHSQPFWAHGTLDLAIVHNGHITNYHKLRRRYEQRGVRFYTENDSEVIGIYLAERMGQGLPLGEALQASIADLDGSFSYLAAVGDALGYAKDPFCLKPLIVAETDEFVALANEGLAFSAAFEAELETRELSNRQSHTWFLQGLGASRAA
jgi:methylamine---glutamate N-methyltransferase subunit A